MNDNFVIGRYYSDQGGYYAGIITSDCDNNTYHIFAAPNLNNDAEIEWGGNGDF